MPAASRSSSADAVGSSRGRATLRIRVTPRAARGGISPGEGHLAVRVRSPAEAGKANEEALRAVAGWLGFPRSRIELISGSTGRLKTVAVDGIEAVDLRKRVAELFGRPR